MAGFVVSKQVKIRKNHKCEMCGITLEKGTLAEVSSGCAEGFMFRYYLCDECRKWINENRSDIDYDDSFDMIAEMKLDQLRDRCRNECAKWSNENNECYAVEETGDDRIEHLRCAEFEQKEAQ